MPELLRKLPARMNSGTASSAKFCVSVTVSWIGMVERQLRMLQEEQRAGNADRERHRHADQHQHREGDEDDQHGVAPAQSDVDGAVLGVLAAQLAAHLQHAS